MTIGVSVERRRLRARRALLSLTTIIVSGLAVPALAQSTAHPNLDANGVDLTDGSFNLRLPIASAGSGQGRLALIAYDGQRDNWSAMTANQTLYGSVRQIAISLGPRYDNFNLAAGSTTASSISGTGATITINSDNSLTYQTLDGTAILFSNPANVQGGASNLCDYANNGNCFRLATSIFYPDQLAVTMNWDVWANCSTPGGGIQEPTNQPADCTYSWRVADVSNSAGYSIGWAYATNSVGSQQNPGPAWFQKVSAQVGSGTVTYGNPSTNTYTITTPAGRTWQITGGSQQITAIRRPGASSDTTTVSYAPNTFSPSAVTQNGITTNYAYSRNGGTATMVVTDAGANRTTIVSDLNLDRPTSITDANGKVTSYSYDGVGRPMSITYPEGNQTTFGYDGRGNLTETRQKAKPSAPAADIVTSALYPASCTSAVTCNSPTWTKDANGNRTDYAYDSTTGQVTSVTSPAPTNGAVQPQTRYSYSSVSGVSVLTGVSQCQTQASCAGTADEVKTSIGYNANLLPTSVSKGAGDGSLSVGVQMGYDAVGNMTSATDPNNATTTMVYDADRRLTMSVGPDPDGSGPLKNRAVQVHYALGGQVDQQSTGTANPDGSGFNALIVQTASYDGNNRRVTSDVRDGSGTVYSLAQYSYDALGRPDCTALRMNPSTYTSLPGACDLGTQESFGPDRIGRTEYDALGRVTKVWDGYRSADAAAAQTSYTDNGQVRNVTDQNGNLTGYAYDGFDRLYRTYYPNASGGGSSGSDYTQTDYDAAGNLTRKWLRGTGNHQDYAYDALNRPVSITVPGLNASDHGTRYSYDNLGRLTYATEDNNVWSSFGYDALGRRVSDGSAYGGTKSFGYDAAGRRTRMAWADGFFVTYEYLVTGEMSGIRENGGSYVVTFGYNDLGQRTALNRANNIYTAYNYDPASRLSGLTLVNGPSNTVRFGYNPAGQITSRTASNDAYAWTDAVTVNRGYGVNGLNQYTSAGSTTFGYDPHGNLTSSGSHSYSYDSFNRMGEYDGGYGSGNWLYYDALGRMNFNNAEQTRFDYDGATAITEIDGNGAIRRRYIHGPGSDEPLVWYEGSGTSDRRFLHADERGSIVAVTNNAGQTLAINSYDEYGIPGANNIGRFQYTGQRWVPSLGMYDYKARMYSPTLGRFLQTDPIGYGDGLNWHAYVGNDPVNGRDPSGLEVGDIVVTGRHLSFCELNPISSFCGGGFSLGGTSPFAGGAGGGGAGGGGAPGVGTGQAPQRTPRPPCSSSESYAGTLAERADAAADATDALAIGAGLGALALSETGIGGAILGGVAVGAKIANGLSVVVAIGAKAADGNYRGAVASGLGFVVGRVAAGGLLGLTKNSLGGEAAKKFNELAADGLGSVPGSKGTEAAVCGLGR